jgi:hypothetical protein
MSTVNSLPSERTAIVGVIDPDAYTANTYTTGYISMAAFGRFQAVILAGTMGTGATLNAKLIGYTDASGTSPDDITGAAITALTQAGTDSDKQAVINFNTDAMAGSGKTHFRLSVTTAVEAVDFGAVVLGFDPRYSPASGSDLASVDEIVSV